MATFQIIPEQIDGAPHNPYCITVGHDDRDLTQGEALIQPPVQLEQDYLDDLQSEAGLEIVPQYSSASGTVVRFATSQDSERPYGEQIRVTFQVLVNELGKTTLRQFKNDWKDEQ